MNLVTCARTMFNYFRQNLAETIQLHEYATEPYVSRLLSHNRLLLLSHYASLWKIKDRVCQRPAAAALSIWGPRLTRQSFHQPQHVM